MSQATEARGADAPTTTVVVGVDGSPGSVAALRFAVEEGRARGAAIRAVTAWRAPLEAYGHGLVPPTPELSREAEKAANESLERAIADVGAEAADAQLEKVVRQGSPAQVLLEEARDAAVLVVGSRGIGGFRGLLLGSVSQQCAHHTTCPIVIVPPPPEP